MLLSSTRKDVSPDEIRCESNQIGLIYDYLKEHRTTRVNIILQDKDIENRIDDQLKYVRQVAPDYTIACSSIAQLREMLKRKYNAYLNFPVSDWETFVNLQDWKVSDILIDGPIGFEMKNLQAKKGDTKVRVCPNFSPNAALSVGNNEDSFYILPENLKDYEPYIDICEIYDKDKDRERTLYNIYKRGTYIGDVNTLIPQIKVKHQNPVLVTTLIEGRLNCGQKCKTTTKHCAVCSKSFKLSDLTYKLSEVDEQDGKIDIDFLTKI